METSNIPARPRPTEGPPLRQLIPDRYLTFKFGNEMEDDLPRSSVRRTVGLTLRVRGPHDRNRPRRTRV